jgi:hypothetical protein
MLRASRLVTVGVLAVTGCSLFTSIDGVSGGDEPSAGLPDATPGEDSGNVVTDANGTNDATSAPDVDADAAPLPNLQPNGGFETINAGACGSEWGVFQGEGTRVSMPRNGTYACRACGNHVSDQNYSLNDGRSTNIAVLPGQRYRVEAWVRAIDAAGEGQAVRGTIRIYETASAVTVVQRIDPPTIALTQTWTRLETVLDISKAGDFNYYVSFDNGPLGSCALIDDVVVQRLF